MSDADVRRAVRWSMSAGAWVPVSEPIVPTQAHAMSHPTAQAEGVQHVSDAALFAWQNYTGSACEHVDGGLRDAGLVMYTREEWQDLQTQCAFATGIVDSMVREQVRLRGEIAELRKQITKPKEVMPNDPDRSTPVANTDRPYAVTGGAHRHNALTFLPEPDNRLGRGNGAMDEN